MTGTRLRGAVRRVVGALAAMLAGLLPAAASALPKHVTGDIAGPVSLASPAWRDLMAEPVLQDQTLAYHAAELAATWGHPEKSAQLRASLLQLHGNALAGAAVPARLGDLLGRPPPAPEALQAAWDSGLNRAWPAAEWDPQPPREPLLAGAAALPQQPGFWRLSEDRLAVLPLLRNQAAVVLALPGPPQLTLQVAGRSVQMHCQPRSGSLRWAPGETARLWCLSLSSVPAEAWPALAQATLSWQAKVVSGDAAQGAWVSLLAGRPPMSLRLLMDRNVHCRDQMNCRRAGTPTTEQLMQHRQQVQALDVDRHARLAREDKARERRERWIALAAVVGGFVVYALVARLLGANLASVVVVLLSLAFAGWLFSYLPGSGWGGIGLLLIGCAAIVWGFVLSFVYRWLYRRFLWPE